MRKKILGLCILCLSCTMLLAGCKNKDQNQESGNSSTGNTTNVGTPSDNNSEQNANTDTTETPNAGTEGAENPNFNPENYLTGKYHVQIDVGNYGSFVVELDADAAPATVTNFVNLVENGFYNGLTFHRIINGFMMQGGDPEANGTGGSLFNVPGEFALNGFENPISHVRGTISMARSSDNYDSASSQFFIVHEDATALDGSYASFGKVIYGMDVVDLICTSAIVEDENGTVNIDNQPFISSMYVIGEEELEIWKLWEYGNLPDPVAEITFASMDSTDGIDFVNTWIIDEDAQKFLLFSSTELLSIGIYRTDLATGIEYDPSAPLGFHGDLGANEYIWVTVDIPEGELPSLLLVAEEHSGAVGQYLICFDEYYGGAYLVPVY